MFSSGPQGMRRRTRATASEDEALLIPAFLKGQGCWTEKWVVLARIQAVRLKVCRPGQHPCKPSLPSQKPALTESLGNKSATNKRDTTGAPRGVCTVRILLILFVRQPRVSPCWWENIQGWVAWSSASSCGSICCKLRPAEVLRSRRKLNDAYLSVV